MKKLIDRLITIKKNKLQSYKTDLKTYEEQALSNLQTEIEELTNKIAKTKSETSKQFKLREDFRRQTKHLFFQEAYKQQLLEDIWQKTISQDFSASSQLKTWLENRWDEVSKLINNLDNSDSQVMIKAGKSYDQLKKLVDLDNVTLQKDEDLVKEEGFIAEASTFVMDARLSVFLKDVYQNQKSTLLKILIS